MVAKIRAGEKKGKDFNTRKRELILTRKKKNKLNAAVAAAGLGGPCPVLHGAQHKRQTHRQSQPSRDREKRELKRGGFSSKRNVVQRIGSHGNEGWKRYLIWPAANCRSSAIDAFRCNTQSW